MPAKINSRSIKDKTLNNKFVKRAVFSTVNKEVNKQKNIFSLEFLSHPVTKELDGGENAGNLSGTLGGYGNLFSFLGFSRGSNPIVPVKLLIQSITLSSNIQATKNGFKLKLNIPSKDEFGSISILPWENGRSWLFDIERGISGFGAYLYGRFKSSRSGGGIQSNYNYSNRIFRPVPYFNKMYNNFLKRLGGK
jgi:hypothetical protein